MTDDTTAIVPVWTLATGEVRAPAVQMDRPMTPERLKELRGVLAALAEQPIATLELHPLPASLDRSGGIPLDAASPLAQHLSDLITRSAKTSPVVAKAATADEVLYRMVVPQRIAAELGQGLIRPMRAKGAAGGIHGALVNSKGIAAQATFVPVGGVAAGAGLAGGAAAGGAAAGGAAAGGTAVAGGAAGAAGGTAAAGAALTVAAPLVLMAVAVGVSAHAEQERRAAIENITKLLEQLHEDKLNDERSELDGCRDAIDKATALVLDQGKLGVALGLDSAVHAISKALAAAERRLETWNQALNALRLEKTVDVETLAMAFPGIDEPGGRFRAHVELAALAVALKRRVIVLQAVEHAQTDPGNQLVNFTRAIRADQQKVDRLESGIAEVLVRLSKLHLGRPQGLHSPVFTSRQVDRMMRAAHLLHGMAGGVAVDSRASEVAIEIARHQDGSLLVLPARSA